MNLADDFKEEFKKLDQSIMLEPVELEIINVLKDENKKMRAGEIGLLIDATHQLVGRRTSKLRDLGLVDKEADINDGKMKNELTELCEQTYF